MEDCQVCIPEEFFTPTNITWAYLISIQHATDEIEHLLSFNILSIEKYQYPKTGDGRCFIITLMYFIVTT